MKPAAPVTSQRRGRAASARSAASYACGVSSPSAIRASRRSTPCARSAAASAWALTSTYSPPGASRATKSSTGRARNSLCATAATTAAQRGSASQAVRSTPYSWRASAASATGSCTCTLTP